jgi:uncharacterized DUF497 family protein
LETCRSRSSSTNSADEANILNHQIDFWDAVLIWDDPRRQERYDAEHSTDSEDRWQIIWMTGLGIILVVYTDKVHNPANDCRIISARKATREEIRRYLAFTFAIEA